MLAALLLAAAFPLIPHPGPQTFAEPVPIDGPFAHPAAVIAADLDGDGLDDTVIFDVESGAVMWARSRSGVGPGQDPGGSPGQNAAQFVTLFSIEREISSFNLPARQLLAADIDGDGDLDVAALVWSYVQGDPSLFVGLNDGAGRVEDLRSYSNPADRLVSMEAIDLTGSGLLGIVVFGRTSLQSGSMGTSFIHRPVGSGVLSSATPLFAGQAPGIQELRKGDLDGDGDEDLILVNASPQGGILDPQLLALPNVGALPLDPASAVRIAGPLSDLQVGDLSGDGLADLLALEYVSPQAVITPLINQGGFSFMPGSALPTPATSLYQSVALGDLDGDGDPDVIGNRRESSASGSVDLFDNQGGAFALLPSVVQTAPYLQALVAGDMTGDGHLDLAGLRGGTLTRELLYTQAGVAPLTYGEFQNLGESFGRGFIGSIRANSDGIADLLMVSGSRGALGEGTIAVRLALGEGRFGPPRRVSAGGSVSRRVYVGDFNGDGIQDVASTSEAEDSILMFPGLGGGDFDDGITALSVPGVPYTMEISDLDGDGADDLVYTTPTGSAVFYAFGDASGTFVDARSIVGSFPQAVAPRAADIDGDGDMDLVYLVSDRIEVSMNSGARAFAPRVTLVAGLGASVWEQVLPADLDLDGVMDLAVVGRSFFRGLGMGTFDLPVDIQGVGASSGRPEALDLDLDGDLDLIFRAGFVPFVPVAWAENVGPLHWMSRGVLGPDLSTFSRGGGDLADFDGDGDLDSLAASREGLLYLTLNSTLQNVGIEYCGPAAANSTGEVGGLTAVGSTDLGVSRLTLRAEDLPAQAAGYFLTSRTQDDVAAVPGSLGRLCVGGSVGRLIGPGQVQNSGAAGVFQLELDLSALPDPALGLIPIQPGETWNFQAWHRDVDSAGSLTSNFTRAVSVGF